MKKLGSSTRKLNVCLEYMECNNFYRVLAHGYGDLSPLTPQGKAKSSPESQGCTPKRNEGVRAVCERNANVFM